MAQIIGPGASKGKGGAKAGMACGPYGPGGLGPDMTTKRGYDSRRTTGLRDTYKVTGNANNSKASK
jgi:hypothetical protein